MYQIIQKIKIKNNETTLFYNSLNLSLYSLLPSHFMPLCYHASLLNHIAQQHMYYLSLSKNFLKLKLDYKSYIYMLNIIHTHTHTHTHIYIYGGRFGYSSECKIYNCLLWRVLVKQRNKERNCWRNEERRLGELECYFEGTTSRAEQELKEKGIYLNVHS